MREREEKHVHFVVRGKADGDNFDDIVAGVAVKDGRGGIAADERLTAAMLSILCRRHHLPPAVTGGGFDMASGSFIRGDGGTTFNAIPGMVNADGADLILYTYGLLAAIAQNATSNARWDLP